jgi:DNA-binding NtrC family response regulator
LIQVPSLQDRTSDIPLLVQHFLQEIAQSYRQPVKKIDPVALEALVKHEWTGNIRELRNVVERLVILSEKNISLSDVKSFVLH